MKRRAFMFAPAALIAARVHAHKLQFSLTDLRWRPDSGALEVVHSIHLDDAMVLLASLGSPRGELDVATQAKVMHYTRRHFSLRVEGKPLVLEPVGAQVDGDYLWIYQERNISTLPPTLEVRCSLLQELFDAQQNQVNLRVGDLVRTLRFDRDHQMDIFKPNNAG